MNSKGSRVRKNLMYCLGIPFPRASPSSQGDALDLRHTFKLQLRELWKIRGHIKRQTSSLDRGSSFSTSG